MKKKVISVTLIAAIIMSMLTVGIFSVSAAEGKIVKTRVTFNQSGTDTEELPAGTSMADYIAEKESEFESTVSQRAGANGEIDDYSSLFTENTYAVVSSFGWGGQTIEYSDGAIVIGDTDDWDNLYVVSGWAAKVTTIVANYTLVYVTGEAEDSNEISEVELEITSPLAGKSLNDTYPSMMNYSVRYYMAERYWCDENGDPLGEDGEIPGDPVFEAGKTYYVHYSLVANDEYEWKQDIENTTLTIHNGNAVGSLYIDDSDEIIDWYGQPAACGVLAVEAVEMPEGLIEAVNVSFNAPAAGDEVTLSDGALTPAPDASISSSAAYSFAEGGEPVWVDSDDFDDYNVLTEPFTFEEFHTYYVYLKLTPDEGKYFNYEYTELYIDTECAYSTSIYFDEYGTFQLIISFNTGKKGDDPEPVESFFGVLISDDEGNVNTGGGYVLSYKGNPSGDVVRTTASNNFVENGEPVSITAVPENGYYFKGWYQGEPNGEAGDPVYSGQPLSTDETYEFTAPLDMDLPYLCAVFAEGEAPPTRPADQIQVWITDGGKAAVEYTPSEPNVYDLRTMDGTDFVSIGEVVQYYKGDEITVYQQADEGYKFKGWYHVRIEWGPGDELPKYEGDVISTDPTFTYKPGVTIVDGDTEPLRYVCAVFEPDQGSDIRIGDVNGDNVVDVLDAAVIQKYAAGNADLTEEQKYVADVNNDDNVDVLDAAEVQKYSAGKISEFKKKS